MITSSESTSSPRSQTALQKRSTITVVLPVPAPAETKTTPCSSIARSCSWFGAVSTTRHDRFTRQIGQSSHQVGQEPPRGSCRTSPSRIRSTTPTACSRARSIPPQKSSSST